MSVLSNGKLKVLHFNNKTKEIFDAISEVYYGGLYTLKPGASIFIDINNGFMSINGDEQHIMTLINFSQYVHPDTFRKLMDCARSLTPLEEKLMLYAIF